MTTAPSARATEGAARPRRIACLHSAASNIALFDAARPVGVTLDHHCRPDLLAAAEQAGALGPALLRRTATALDALATPGIDAILLTCSTLGPAVDAARAARPILRVDAALAEAACAGGGPVAVLCTVGTTLAPTGALFAAAAARHGASVTLALVPDAWAAFRAGDADGYAGLIAAAARDALAAGAARVALAQASMAPAAALLGDPRVLASPAAGLAAALAAAQ